MKNKITNAMLYTWLCVLYTAALSGILGGAYLLVELILANLQ